MKKVLVYRERLLAASETFIRNQILSLQHWEPVLVGLKRVKGLSLDGLNARVLRSWNVAKVSPFLDGLAQRAIVSGESVAGQLRRENASLVHIHFGTDAVGIWPALSRMDVPVLITLHGYDIQTSKETWESGPWLMRSYPDQLIRLAQQSNVVFLAVSHAIRERAIEYGIPAAKIHVRYIGIDISKFRPTGRPLAERPPRILFVGRLVEKKGAAYLIEAFARVRKEIPNAELTMVGDGRLRKELTELAKTLQVPVVFRGSLSGDEVKNEMDRARVFCLPSITARGGDAEGLGIVILEAQACGVPVVTSAKGGATEAIVDGVTGFAFPERDVEVLTQKLLRLLRDDGLATSMSQQGQTFVSDRFELHKCTGSLEALYDALA